jgi:hypothetical protein
LVTKWLPEYPAQFCTTKGRVEKQYGSKGNRKRKRKVIKEEKTENMVNAVKQRKKRRGGRENCC